MNILYIDDDPEDREFFKDALRQLDPAILYHSAKDGSEGLKILRELIVMPDYIFVDVNMPVMNGKEFLIEIKKLKRFRSIPVVVYSTTTHPGELLSYQELGAHKILVKPNSLSGISRLINSVISSEPVPRQEYQTISH